MEYRPSCTERFRESNSAAKSYIILRNTISEIQQIVAALAKQYGARQVYLFGSYARGDMAVNRFGKSYDTFSNDPVYRNAVSLCILQIGELVGNLSEAFRAEHPSIPYLKAYCEKLLMRAPQSPSDPEFDPEQEPSGWK